MLRIVAYAVRCGGDPGEVLAVAGSFLRSRPVEHNLILTLMEARQARPEPGRYWIVEADGEVSGVVLQSPLEFTATMTPMPSEAIVAVIDAMLDQDVRPPAVNGEARTAALFAGTWAERTRSPVYPDSAQRIYELKTLALPARSTGQLRQADAEHRDLLVGWMRGFAADTEPGASSPEDQVDARLADGQVFLWQTDGPVSMAAHRPPVAGVSRIGPVYTPPEERGRGYASACVGMLSQLLNQRGDRCILYADLANPSSNAIYQRLGYRAAVETLRYRFDRG